MLSVAITLERVEAALAAGELAYPACSGRCRLGGSGARARCGSQTSSAAHPAAGALWRVRDNARDLSLVDGSASARRSGGDRRSTTPGGHRRWAPADRPAPRTAGGHGLGPLRAARRRAGTCARARPGESSRLTEWLLSPQPTATWATRSRRSCSRFVPGCCGSVATPSGRGNEQCG